MRMTQIHWLWIVYTPVEVIFPNGETFQHFDLKFIDYQDLKVTKKYYIGTCKTDYDLSYYTIYVYII